LAGLFSDVLSQAQKGLSLRGGETAKAPAGETHKKDGTPRGAEVTKSLADGTNPEIAKALEGAKGFPRRAETSEAARPRVLGPEGMRGSSDRPASEVSDKVRAAMSRQTVPERPERIAGAHPGLVAERRREHVVPSGEASDAAASHAGDDRRRIREKRQSVSDETPALAVANANVKLVPSTINPPKAKTPLAGIEEDASVDRKKERNSSDPKVTVLDLRRSSETRNGAAPKTDSMTEDLGKDPVREAKSQGSETGRENYRELTLEARGSGETNGSRTAGNTDATSGRGQDFRSIMAERMRDAWNGEIVQNAHIVLRDGDTGIIRLRLKPESLGNVKIELNLSENNISGRIVVESDEAKSAFERNMNDLADAFRQGGFDSARLEVAVGGSSGGGAHPGGARPDPSTGPFFSERLRGAVGSAAGSATATSAYSRRGGAIDILA
jgi:flagellar hook-length control protein FliK